MLIIRTYKYKLYLDLDENAVVIIIMEEASFIGLGDLRPADTEVVSA